MFERQDPEKMGLRPEQLSRIGAHLSDRYVKPGKIAGSLTLICRGGQVGYLEALGQMDIERGRPMTDDTIFRIYSMSKPITSVAMMMLYEQGMFQLEDAVERWIPEFRDLRVFVSGTYPDFETRACERPMCVQDLMTHMSGFTYGHSRRTAVDAAYRKVDMQGERADTTLDEMVGRLAELPLEFTPRSAWNYSVSTDVCGVLVERISGMPLDRYFQEKILAPLQMVDTGFEVPEASRGRFATNYARNAHKRLVIHEDAGDCHHTRPVTFFSGGGGLVSTASDYLRFCQMMLNGGELGGVRLLGRKTVDFMTRNHLPGGSDLASLALGSFSETRYEGVGFGLGFSTTLNPAHAQVIGSTGEYAWGGMASTLFWIDPMEDLIVLFMTQLTPSRTFNFRGQLKSLIYPALV